MIYAKNQEALAYRGIHPNLDLALEHITPEFLASLRDGQRVELQGDQVYCTRFTYETIPQEESFFEAHRRYLDIHIMVEGEERALRRAPPRSVPGGLPRGRPPHQGAGGRPQDRQQSGVQGLHRPLTAPWTGAGGTAPENLKLGET